MQSRKIFNDTVLDEQFKRDGYVVLDNILSRNRAAELYTICKSMESGVDAPFYTTFWSSNTEYRQKVNRLIEDEISPVILPYLYDYVPLFGDLLVKRPSFNKKFPMHQDWTFVDENLYTSIFVWCPLSDVNYLNGNLQVVRGSHHFSDKIRGANIPVSYEAIKGEIANKYLINIPLKKGQAIIFNHALLHASPPNRSLKTRIAMGLLLLPREAEIYHYYRNKEENNIRRLKVDRSFYMSYSDALDFNEALNSGSLWNNKYSEGEIMENQVTIKILKDFQKDLEEYCKD